ncbi:MAG TPA: hypothetical protein VFM70_04595 [Salinimicrobium sp.]|nr:hypothetical protein [Salinimicrobium sp.]
MNLNNLIEARSRFSEHFSEEGFLYGNIEKVDQDDIDVLKKIEDAVYEVKKGKGDFITLDQVHKNIGSAINVTIEVGLFDNYYSSLLEFVEKNKYDLKTTVYFIEEYEISSSDVTSKNIIRNYLQNLSLIELLELLSNHSNSSACNLKLYFHKVGESLILPIEYTVDNLRNMNIEDVAELKREFSQDIHKSERKKLFINELINLYSGQNKDYSLLLKNWSLLKESYYNSYDSFLEGFSFDKIKTSSLEHFHDLNDKIHETVRKVSNYIFGIPIAFLFLISRLEFSNPSTLKNISLLGVGYLFILLIWKIFFKSIKESLDSIKEDISRYEAKIKHVSNLSSIVADLRKLKDETLKNQYDKLSFLKTITVIIAVGLTILVSYLGWEDIVDLVMNILSVFRFIFLTESTE